MQLVRRAVRCEGRMGSKACGAVRKWDCDTLTLARGGRGRTLQSPRHGHGEELSRVGTPAQWAEIQRYQGYLRTGTGDW